MEMQQEEQDISSSNMDLSSNTEILESSDIACNRNDLIPNNNNRRESSISPVDLLRENWEKQSSHDPLQEPSTSSTKSSQPSTSLPQTPLNNRVHSTNQRTNQDIQSDGCHKKDHSINSILSSNRKSESFHRPETIQDCPEMKIPHIPESKLQSNTEGISNPDFSSRSSTQHIAPKNMNTLEGRNYQLDQAISIDPNQKFINEQKILTDLWAKARKKKLMDSKKKRTDKKQLPIPLHQLPVYPQQLSIDSQQLSTNTKQLPPNEHHVPSGSSEIDTKAEPIISVNSNTLSDNEKNFSFSAHAGSYGMPLWNIYSPTIGTGNSSPKDSIRLPNILKMQQNNQQHSSQHGIYSNNSPCNFSRPSLLNYVIPQPSTVMASYSDTTHPHSTNTNIAYFQQFPIYENILERGIRPHIPGIADEYLNRTVTQFHNLYRDPISILEAEMYECPHKNCRQKFILATEALKHYVHTHTVTVEEVNED